MPFVTATPRGQNNGQVITEFIDSVGTSSVTFTYPKTQESLSVRNVGTKAITVTLGGTSQVLQPGQKWDNTSDFTSFDIVSSSGVQAFEATADEKGSTLPTGGGSGQQGPQGLMGPQGPQGVKGDKGDPGSGGGGTTAAKDNRQVVGKKNQASFNSSTTYGGTKGGYTYCQRIIFACDCYDVQFLFVNPMNILGAGAANAIKLKVSLETLSGLGDFDPVTFYPLSSNGIQEFTVNPDQFAWTDKFPLAFKKGDRAYLRIYVTSTTNKHPTGPSLSAAYAAEGRLDGDYTNFPAISTARSNTTRYSTDGSTTFATGSPTHQNSWGQPGGGATYAADADGYAAVLCVGKPSPTATPYPVVANIGDSISRAVGSDNAFTWGLGYGFMQKAIDAAEGAWIDLGENGQSAAGFTGTAGFDRWMYLDYCTHALVEYGVNDIALTAASDARITQITSDLQTIYSVCKSHGIGKVYACTPVIRTNSTDVWATIANQTAYNAGFTPRANAGNNTWQDLISWIKGNSITPGSGGAVIPAPVDLDGFYDTAAAVTALKADNTPVWAVGKVATSDGLGVHPSGAGHTAMAAVIPVSAFA